MEAFDQEPDKKRPNLEQEEAGEDEGKTKVETVVADTERLEKNCLEAVATSNSGTGIRIARLCNVDPLHPTFM